MKVRNKPQVGFYGVIIIMNSKLTAFLKLTSGFFYENKFAAMLESENIILFL